MINIGVVENRDDPLKLGRYQVRVVGLHTHDKLKLPTEDLPWTVPTQPVGSAAISGVGTNSGRLVTGSVVAVEFLDSDNQIPIIVATIPGIPQDDGAIDYDYIGMLLKSSAGKLGDNESISTDDAGRVIRDVSDIAATAEKVLQQPANKFNPSADASALVIKHQSARLEAYSDNGTWKIGYGTPSYRGSAVKEGLVISGNNALTYLDDYLERVIAPVIQNNVKVLLTQEMFDSLCAVAYDIGPSAFTDSAILTNLNSGDYLGAVNRYFDYTTSNQRSVARRTDEKDAFISGGIPSADGQLVTEQSNAPLLSNAARRASVLGFRDPTGVWPSYKYEPDVNRLARHEHIEKTIVRKKEASRQLGVQTAGGKTWDQPPIPYNADYPFNSVHQSESGHVVEIDDTPNAERLQTYHRTGTFHEIDSNGSEVTRIVGEKYEIVERDGHLYIKGSNDVTIDGDSNIKIKNALNVDVDGAATINIYNNAKINVSGSAEWAVKESFKVKAKSIVMEASGGNIDLQASGNINGDGSQVWFNSGKSSSSGLTAPASVKETRYPRFDKLTYVTRTNRDAANYDTPDDGDPEEYITYRDQTGTFDNSPAVKNKEETVSTAPVVSSTVDCSEIENLTKFPASLRLSERYTLGDLNKAGTRPLVSQFSLSPQQIACNLKALCVNCLDPIKNLYPSAIITSGFRRPGDVANSSPRSDHYLGFAADIVIKGFTREEHYEAVKVIEKLIPYHQLILEYDGPSSVWIHVAYKDVGSRNQLFTMRNHRRASEDGKLVLFT